ncbi:hypothetical protein D3C79_971960 [compost metagenome]
MLRQLRQPFGLQLLRFAQFRHRQQFLFLPQTQLDQKLLLAENSILQLIHTVKRLTIKPDFILQAVHLGLHYC